MVGANARHASPGCAPLTGVVAAMSRRGKRPPQLTHDKLKKVIIEFIKNTGIHHGKWTIKVKPSDLGTGPVTERFTVIVHFLNRSLMNTVAHVVWISQLFKQVMLLVFGPGGTIFYIVLRVTHMPQKKGKYLCRRLSRRHSSTHGHGSMTWQRARPMPTARPSA